MSQLNFTAEETSKYDTLFVTVNVNDSWYKAEGDVQKIKIVIPSYIKNIGESITLNFDRKQFNSDTMTLDYMTNNILKDCTKHPKLQKYSEC